MMKKLYIAALIAVNGSTAYASDTGPYMEPKLMLASATSSKQEVQGEDKVALYQGVLDILTDPRKASGLSEDRKKELYDTLVNIIKEIEGGSIRDNKIFDLHIKIDATLNKYSDNPATFPKELNETFPYLKEYITFKKQPSNYDQKQKLGSEANDFIISHREIRKKESWEPGMDANIDLKIITYDLAEKKRNNYLNLNYRRKVINRS